MIGKIIGTGSFVPNTYLDNDQIAANIESSDAWIYERTGIKQRHVISKDEDTASMACKAALNAVQSAGVEPSVIDLILVTTLSSNTIMPATACVVQKFLGASNATCFDLNAACSGFVLGLQVAQAYIQSQMYRTVLVIGAESLTNFLDWTDRGTSILFGDGAGAVILQGIEGDSLPFISGSDGANGESLTLLNSYPQHPNDQEKFFIEMNGKEVFKFAVKKVPSVITELIDKSDYSLEEIDYIVLHQANRRIIESIAKKLKLPIEKFPMNIENFGNTSSASIPLLLDTLNKNQTFKADDKLILMGFGAGLTWAASILVW